MQHPEAMYAAFQLADEAGLQLITHAIGDRANHTILDMYERLEKEDGPRDRRDRIEHAQTLLPEDIPRFAQLHVIASVQPYHAIDDGRWAERRIGPERVKYTYAFRSLMDSGAVVAFGSDWPVAPLVPLTGIYAAVTRRTIDGKNPGGWMPQQKVTVAESVKAYTYNAAYAEREETIKGRIARGTAGGSDCALGRYLQHRSGEDRGREGGDDAARWAGDLSRGAGRREVTDGGGLDPRRFAASDR